MNKHPSIGYAWSVVTGGTSAPKYVKKQCDIFIRIANGDDPDYIIDEDKLKLIDNLLKLFIMPKGLMAGKSVYECFAGFDWLFIVAVLCTVYRNQPQKRRYETALLEIARKNGKTFLIAVTFLLLFFLEPRFSKFYSVAPDGSLSREVKSAIVEIISCSPALEKKFKIRRDDILCLKNQNDYIPLNYSNSRLDGKLPSVFLVDETGALPNNYAIEAMRSGQITILNKLGCIISTKYPTSTNPFEDEVSYSKKVLDGVIQDDTIFALLYEPDDTKNWMDNDEVLEHANPLAIEIHEIWEDLIKKRNRAIEVESARENFLCKHCNIIYQGIGTESYIPIESVKKCRVEQIDWSGREVYLGLDLAMTNDNCSVSMVSEESGTILAESFAFVPEGRIEEKNRREKLDYHRYIRQGKCFACGDMTVDYGFIEEMILGIEKRFGVHVVQFGFDRYNCLSTAQRLERDGQMEGVQVEQHSRTLHAPTKLLSECVENGMFAYERNDLLEINFENARCTFDTNLNRYVNKKRSNGKVDMVISLIIAVYLLQQNVYLGELSSFGAQVI